MGKYDGLRRYLRRKRQPEMELSFNDIERMTGALLPKAARERQWWTGEPDAAVQRIAWRDAGYEAALMGQDRVIFRRRA
jgi:hypothetical protein